MAQTTKAYLNKVKYQEEMHDLLLKAAQVEVTLDGNTTTLAAVLESISSDISSLPTTTAVNTAISTAIAASGHAHFETAAAVPSVEDASENILYLVMNDTTNHYDIYAKVKGDGDTYTVERLDDTTVDLSGYIQKVTNATAGNLATLTAEGNVADSGKKIGGGTLSDTPDANTLATEAAVAAGLSGKASNETVAAIPRIRVGTDVPVDMRNGDVFVQIVTTTTTE